MNERLAREEKLERLLDEALRGLPGRRAPPSLESRILFELRRAAARRWWHRGFAHWPLPARCAFFLVCGAVIGLTVIGLTMWDGALATLLARTIPSLWLYLGLTAGAMLYVILFGLGAAAYRTLYLHSFNGG